ncbi:MAG: hypothetical protein IT318_16475 [Anaerolineales bacterium]|nr:hypothetical protein [Anaerolineales bacterium]
MDIRLDDLRTYARCPLEWFWERRAGVPRPRTIASLLPTAIRTGLEFYYQGHADSLATAVNLVWHDWCEGWGEPALARELAQYAAGRAKILDLFSTGRVQRPDGGRYAVPEMTNEYRMRMHSAGLTNLVRSLDEFARTHGLIAPDESNRPGSALGDAFADCMAMAERNAPDLPAPAVVLGWVTPFEADLDNGMRLIGQADLMVRAESEDGAVIVEVHDFEPAPWVRAGLAGRDLRVIAAALAQPSSSQSESAGLSWQRVDHVKFRHWPTGQAFAFRETNTGHLLALAAAIARGMQHHVVIPRAVTGYESCRACAYREHCWGQPGWEVLPLLDAGLLGWAEAHRDAFQRLRQDVANDAALATQMRASVAVLEQALEGLPGSSILASVLQVLEMVD